MFYCPFGFYVRITCKGTCPVYLAHLHLGNLGHAESDIRFSILSCRPSMALSKVRMTLPRHFHANHPTEFPDIRSEFHVWDQPNLQLRKAVDYFRKCPERPAPLACFLSHVHSDHLQGLESFRTPFIYCSPATREVCSYPSYLNSLNWPCPAAPPDWKVSPSDELQ